LNLSGSAAAAPARETRSKARPPFASRPAAAPENPGWGWQPGPGAAGRSGRARSGPAPGPPGPGPPGPGPESCVFARQPGHAPDAAPVPAAAQAAEAFASSVGKSVSWRSAQLDGTPAKGLGNLGPESL